MVPKSLTNTRLHPVRQKGFTLKFPNRDEPAAEGIFTRYSILHMLNSSNQYNMTYFVTHVRFHTTRRKHGSVWEIVIQSRTYFTV